jgi:hypothetical protein
VFRASQPDLHDAARGDSVSGMKRAPLLRIVFERNQSRRTLDSAGVVTSGGGRTAAGPFRQGSARQVELI